MTPKAKHESLKLIPQIDKLLLHPELEPLREKYPKLMTRFAREATDELRRRILKGDNLRRPEAIAVKLVKTKLELCLEPRLKSVINATGVILHTGLGRAPLPPAAQENLSKISRGYSNVEYNLESGKRGERLSLVDSLICELTGAEYSAVVNNNAAAVLLSLNSIANRREVIVSRGELVEIGGSFRIPEVMKKSGAKMVEIGTTNKTKLDDYADAITHKTGAILKVHTSNYKVLGFTQEVDIRDIVALAKERSVPVISDLGGGVLVDLRKWGLPYEPIASEQIEAGVDLVTFSGDKVLGGPQCGIIVGRKWAVAKCRKNHLMRALRLDKLIYAALEPTLMSYLSPGGLLEENPALRMLAESPEEIQRRAEDFLHKLQQNNLPGLKSAELRASYGQAGSGALPLEKLPSYAVYIKPKGSLAGFAKKLRSGDPPVVGILQNDELVLDFRTIFPEQSEELLKALVSALNLLKGSGRKH